MALYKNFDLKPMLFDLDEIKKTAESVKILNN